MMKSAICKRWPRLVGAAIAVATMLLSMGAARSVGTFVPAPERADMVHDDARELLYISNGTQVLRYRMSNGTFLPPFELGGALLGMDLSPDGNTLAVADKTREGEQKWIHLINLQNGVARKVLFTRDPGESGSWSVAFGSDGAVLISSQFEGSGWVPLRRYDPATETASVIDAASSGIRQRTMLSASADRSVIGFAEANISDGRFGRYRISDANLLRKQREEGTRYFNYDLGVNRDGAQYAIPTYGGTFIYSSDLVKINTLGVPTRARPIGVAYSPTQDILYCSWNSTREVRAFDTQTWEQVAAFDFEHTFDGTGDYAFDDGRLKTSRDGTLLFCTVDGGVRFTTVAAPVPTPTPTSTPTATPTPSPTPTGNFIAGLVRIKSGTTFVPIAGATVYAIRLSDNQRFSTTSGSDGTYTLTGLTEGRYALSPVTQGYSYAFAPAGGQTRPVVLNTSTPSRTGLNFLARPVFPGIIIDASGRGRITGVTVRARRSAGGGASATTFASTSNALGQFNVVGDGAGSYTLSALKANTLLRFVPASFGNPVSIGTTLQPAASYNFRSIGLFGRVVLGGVNSTTGIANRQVAVYAGSDTALSTPLQTVTTDAGGFYGFDGLSDGTYRVAPVPVGGGTYSPGVRVVALAGAPKLVGAFGFAPSGGVASNAVSPVALSTASAQNDAVTLTFTGPLSASATETSRYAVSVNGTSIEVESATLNGSTVTLLLPDGALKSGDEARVGYHLEDAQGRTLTGEANVKAR